MSSWLGQFHDFTKKYDPLGHALVDGAWKSSTKLVNETSKGLSKVGGALGISTKLPDYGTALSQKDKDSFSRWGENTLGSVAALYGGASALGGSGSAASGGSGALGSSGVPWAAGVDAGAGGASGLGYAEAGGGFVGNAGAEGGAGSFFGSGSSAFNPQMAQQGARMLGNKGQQGSDSGAIQRQLALAEMMRRHSEEQNAAGQLPGWVEMA